MYWTSQICTGHHLLMENWQVLLLKCVGEAPARVTEQWGEHHWPCNYIFSWSLIPRDQNNLQRNVMWLQHILIAMYRSQNNSKLKMIMCLKAAVIFLCVSKRHGTFDKWPMVCAVQLQVIVAMTMAYLNQWHVAMATLLFWNTILNFTLATFISLSP